MPRLLKYTQLCKCQMCRRHTRVGRVIDRDRHLVLCDICNKKYIYNSKKRYIRSRGNRSGSKHERLLLDTIMDVLSLSSRDISTDTGYPDWSISVAGGLLRFDIVIGKYKLLIDYHGEQHYRYIDGMHNNIGEFKRQKDNDLLKTKLAPINGWNYIIFNYTENVGDEEWVGSRLRMVERLSQVISQEDR